MMNEFPSFEKSLELIHLVHTGSVVHVFNKMFSDKILVVTNKSKCSVPILQILFPEVEALSQRQKVLSPMMVNNYRNIPNILFPLFPECAQSRRFAYNKKLDSVYFPNYLVQRADFVLSNLQKFKAGSFGKRIVGSSSSSSLQVTKPNSKSGAICKLKVVAVAVAVHHWFPLCLSQVCIQVDLFILSQQHN